MLGAAGPDLLAIDHVGIAVAHRAGLERERVGAARRLGDAECLQPQFARGDAGEIGALLLLAAVAQQRVHDVHLRVRAGAVASGRLDFLHDYCRIVELEPAAAVFLGDQRGEEARLCQRIDELAGIGARPILLAPVFAGKLGTQRAHRASNFVVISALVHAGIWLNGTPLSGR